MQGKQSVVWWALAIAVLIAANPLAVGQPTPFDSGSTGADGELVLDGPAGTVIEFDPLSFDPPLDPEGDQVFHFTRIEISENVRLRLSWGNLPNGPVYFLCSGDVDIRGIIDLDGENGTISSFPTSALPGPGGFGGGFSSPNSAASATGFGPGGGGFNNGNGQAVGGGFALGAPLSGPTFGGQAYGNKFLFPLIGGSGGGAQSRSGGGAGGGALLVASNTSIRISGTIRARGGSGLNAGISQWGAGGSGGAVRLLSPSVLMPTGGVIETSGGGGGAGSNPGSIGRIRIEARSSTIANPADLRGFVSRVRLVPQTRFLPADEPRLVRVTAINNVTVPAMPSGSIFMPDVLIDAVGPVPVDIVGQQIPLGGTMTLYIWSDTEGMQTLTASPVAGTTDQWRATAAFPSGVSQLFVRAVWQP